MLASMMERLPTFDDVKRAAAFLSGKVKRTPVIRSPELDAIAGAELHLKAECMQHIGAFKARGATYCVGMLTEAERQRGVITYSSGNHAQAVALAARRYGVRCDVAMPEDAPDIKVKNVRALGAHIVVAGLTSDDRKKVAHEIQAKTGGIIIQPFDDPHIIAGQGTATLELFDEVGELDALLVPVGGGGLIAGACLVAAGHDTKIYSVEPHNCDAMGQSLEAGERVPVQPGPTIADGLKPVMVGELNFAIAKEHVSAALRVDDAQIGRALSSLVVFAKTLVEPSGAAALAAALSRMVPGKPRRIGVLLSGGNFSAAQLSDHLKIYPPSD
jgi:threonine dehydratase